jgi:DNA mismatch repair ATPase MutL
MFHSEANLVNALKEQLTEFLMKARSTFERDPSLPPPAEEPPVEVTHPPSSSWPTSEPALPMASPDSQPKAGPSRLDPPEPASQEQDFPDSGRPAKKQRMDSPLNDDPPRAVTAIEIDSDEIDEPEQPAGETAMDLDADLTTPDEDELATSRSPDESLEAEKLPLQVVNVSKTSWASALESKKSKMSPKVELFQKKLPFVATSPPLFRKSPIEDQESTLQDSDDEAEPVQGGSFPRPSRSPPPVVQEMLRRSMSPSDSFLEEEVQAEEDELPDDSSRLVDESSMQPEDTSELLDEPSTVTILSELEGTDDPPPAHNRTASINLSSIAASWQSKASTQAIKAARIVSEAQNATLDDDQTQAEAALSRTIDQQDFRDMHICGQFNLGFILVRRTRMKDNVSEADDLFIVDQHASDEKFWFESLTASTRLESQRELV